MFDRCPRKFDVQTSYNICCELQRSRLRQKNSIFTYRARGQTEKTIIDYHEEF